MIFWGSRGSETLANRGEKTTKEMVDGTHQSTNQPLLLFLSFFFEVKNSLWAWDTSATRRLRSFPSWTHFSTSWRSSTGTYKVRVRFSSFQVRSDTSWRGPSWAHRHRGLPHLFFVTFREAWTKGFILRRVSRAVFPRSFFISGRVMFISIYTFHIMSTKKCTLRKIFFPFATLAKKKTGWVRIRNAKNSHSSLLTTYFVVFLQAFNPLYISLWKT